MRVQIAVNTSVGESAENRFNSGNCETKISEVFMRMVNILNKEYK
jgi:hypothetical protein